MKRRIRTGRRGAAMVEFAFMFPIVMVFFFAMLEYGRYFAIKDLMQNAAREGARYAAVTTSDPTIIDGDITAWVDRAMSGQQASLTGYTVTVFRTDDTGADLGSWKNAAYSQQIAVRVEGTHSAIMPVFPWVGTDGIQSMRIISDSVALDVRAVVVAEAN